MGWDSSLQHYTNEDNPFGDSKLTSTFRWQKKLEKEGLDKVDDYELQRHQRMKFEEQKRELEKVKQRRLEREREREDRRAMMELEERSRENEKFCVKGGYWCFPILIFTNSVNLVEVIMINCN